MIERSLSQLSIFVLLVELLSYVSCVEMTFELEDNSKQCFFQDIKKGDPASLEFQVISGGRYDVDCTIEDEDGLKIYFEKRKQYDAYQWDAQKTGTYKVCFSNEFSTITHKVVYFDLTVGGEKPLLESMDRSTALSQIETSCVSIHEFMKQVINFQTHFRLRESLGRTFAENISVRVQLWSTIQVIIMISVMVGQVFILRSFFANKVDVGRRTKT